MHSLMRVAVRGSDDTNIYRDPLLQRENPRIGGGATHPAQSKRQRLCHWGGGLLRYVELARRVLSGYPELFIGFTGAPAEAGPNNQLANEVGLTASSGLPEKRLCDKCSC